MKTDRPIAEGFSADGYICDQDCFSSLRYRGIPASINGCGWIAAYNLRRFAGQDPDWDQTRREMDAMHRLRAPGPTSMRVMREYLARFLPEVRETQGREAAIRSAAQSRAGIFRYREGQEPHFICYLRQADGRFRFLNMADGQEDCLLDMEAFGREHLRGGYVSVFTLP